MCPIPLLDFSFYLWHVSPVLHATLPQEDLASKAKLQRKRDDVAQEVVGSGGRHQLLVGGREGFGAAAVHGRELVGAGPRHSKP